MNNKKSEIKEEIVKDEYNLNKELTQDEFDRALRYTKNRSAPDVDDIKYEMLKKSPEKYKKELLKIINHCFEKGTMTKTWKMNQTIFIDKEDKKKKVRPITMSSCVSKIMERKVNERLMWSEKERILDNWQNGFRRGRSCLNNLARVRMEIETASRTGRELLLHFWT